MLDFQQQLDQFFQGNDRGYPRDPRRMAYAKLRKNTLGMDREQLEAFVNANLFIPHSQYKMALANLISFLRKYDEMNKLNEVRRFQKIAGILKESFDPDAPQSNSYEDVIDWLDQLYPDASQYSEFLAGFEKELQHLTPEERAEWIAKFKRDFGESLNEWHPDDPSSIDIDDIRDEDPEDYDDMSETVGQSPTEILGDLIDNMQDDEEGLDQGLSPSELIDYDQVAKEAVRLGLRVDIKKLKQLAKANDTGFLYSGEEMVSRALPNSIKEGADYESETGDTATMGNINENAAAHVAYEVQKLVDDLLEKGKIGPKQAKMVMDYVKKHGERLYHDLERPEQWFNAAADSTWRNKGHRLGTRPSE
jgi:hypothetical protein